jgi:hypothetical protein
MMINFKPENREVFHAMLDLIVKAELDAASLLLDTLQHDDRKEVLELLNRFIEHAKERDGTSDS